MYASQVWATPFLRQGKQMDNPLQEWLVTVLKRVLMVKDTTPSWCVMRECDLEPLQFNWFRAVVLLYNVFILSISSTAREILQADMRLSSRRDDCWSSHILSAMNGLTQSYLLKERLLKNEPIDLSCFADLRERRLDKWTPYSHRHPCERYSKHSTYHQWCAHPTKRALVTHSPYTLLRHMLLHLPRYVIRS